MQIQGLQATSAAQPTNRTQSAKPANPVESTSPAPATTDQLDLSPEAQALSASQAAGQTEAGIRADKVASIRQAIADGTYETPEKMSAALDRMLDTFA